MLSIRNLSLHHKRPIFSHLNLEISRGEFLHLRGFNGAGKTSFLRILAGLVPLIYPGRVQGEILRDGRNLLEENSTPGVCLTGPWAASRLFCRTVWEEVTFSPGACEKEALQLLRYFGIEELKEAHPQKLSGGQQQLVLLCAYLSCRPELILLDESFAPLSPDKADLLTALLVKLHNKGRTILLVEHRLPRGLEGVVRPFDITPPVSLKKVSEKGVRGEGYTEKSDNRCYETGGQTPALLSIRNLKVKIHRDQSLSYDNFSLNQGEILYLKGAVGSGKSTLIRGLLGLNPVEGEVIFKGKNLHSLSFKQRSRHMGVILQSPDSQFFCDTVEQEITFSARYLKAEDKTYIHSLYQTFHLDPVLQQHPSSLSHGEKKKCQIAAALSLKPKILILDEPDAGLDQESLSVMIDFFRDYVKQGNSILFTSHNRDFLKLTKQAVRSVRTYHLKEESDEN